MARFSMVTHRRAETNQSHNRTPAGLKNLQRRRARRRKPWRLAGRWTPRRGAPRDDSPRHPSGRSLMSSAAPETPRYSCTAFPSTGSSGAARSIGCRRTGDASRRISWGSDTRRSPRARASRRTRRAPCSRRCSTHARSRSLLAALLDSLSISVVDLVANDSGGAVAQLFLIRHPKRVRTLLLTNCDVETDSPPPALLPVIEMARAGTFVDKWFVPWVADKTLARSAEGLGGLTYTFRANPTDEAVDYSLAPLVSSPQRKAQVHAYAIALEPNSLAGIERELKRCAVPTRIVWGTGDDIFSQKSPDYLDQILPNSRGVRRVEGAKLFFPEEFPDIIADEERRLWGGR